ncbi:MAG: glycosyltransferase family 2 protein [Herpetosiphon sp.]
MKPQTLPISVIVLTKNEEKQIVACLESVVNWAGEIIVVDSGSTDRTQELAKKYTPHIVSHHFENYSAQRNWSQDNVSLSYNWVFHLDAGEQVSQQLVASMWAAFRTEASAPDGFLISRQTIFLGRWIKHGGLYPTYHLRLYRRGKGFCEDREYDQHFRIEGTVATLSGDILDHITPDLASWTISHERWATAEAREQLKLQSADATTGGQVRPIFRGTSIERRRWLRLKVYGKVPLFIRPFMYFVIRYVLRRGFLDGVEGLVYHVLHGFWYRFYVDAKIWEMKHKTNVDLSIHSSNTERDA